MQPMKESIVTILHGIKAWGDASISRLREDLQRQIRAVRQTAVAAKQSADNADKRIGQLWDGMDGAYERLSELEARPNEELKLISHDTFQESVSMIGIPSLSCPFQSSMSRPISLAIPICRRLGLWRRACELACRNRA